MYPSHVRIYTSTMDPSWVGELKPAGNDTTRRGRDLHGDRGALEPSAMHARQR